MPRNGDEIIKELIDSIEKSVNGFQKTIPAIQKDILKRVEVVAEGFTIPANTIKQQADNLKLISKIKGELNSAILTDEYKDSIKEFTKSFDAIAQIQDSYFSAVFSEKVSGKSLLKQITKTSVELTVDKLSEEGIVSGMSNKIRDILNRNVSSGASFSDLTSEMRSFLTDKEDVPGALTRYTKQITNDSLNTFSAQYTQAITEDLGLKWFKYVGSLIKSSRPFCNALIHAKTDCMPYIHISQLNSVASGNICGKQVSLAGMIPGTNGINFPINRGGYNCSHQLMPVSEAVVPKEFRDKFE